MTVQEYIDKIHKRYITGISREHSYRGDLQTLLETLAPDVLVTNEPARVACGAPDYIITRKNIPVGYIEAKDIGADLNNKTYKEQFDRYKQSLNNLIITDYLNFQLFIDGGFVTSISIGEIQGSKIVARPENFAGFTDLIKNFCIYTGQTIKSASKLSKMMAGKARLLANVIERALDPDISDGEIYEPQNLNLHNQYESFKQILIHDITVKSFADIYSQTIAYGMFAARLHDTSLENFTRQEAAELIPKSNPFLRKLFQYVAGYDLDDRIKWIVDALADIFRATNVEELLKDFGKSTHQHDPMIHFYETFLTEYDPALRKSRGVWYTPEPVVNFIVRAVDDILKTEFGLSNGLADTSKIKIKVQTTGTGKYVDKEVHRVQILDPAAGTGTFLAEVIKQIYHKFEGQQGIWSQYVDEHLLPRLNGFEILMASYAMAHLKLDILLTETGYKSSKEQRFRIYLTNSLEEHHPDTGTLFANWLSTEANEANHVKRDTPVMVVLGNPPYSGESSNKGKWIMDLMEDYKKEPGGKEKLNERNPKWINDDYVKFLRYGQYFIEKNNEGILAFINPHGFLDNPTFRGMRWKLLSAYDKIYTIDLHGNSKKKEVSPDGSADVNVFDIMQGVSINFLIKNGKKKKNELAKVFHFDLYGKREMKYDFLWNNRLSTVSYKELQNISPQYLFVPKDLDVQNDYNHGFKLSDIMQTNVLGFQTHRDKFAVDPSINDLHRRIQDFVNPEIDDNELKHKYNINESGTWQLAVQREKLSKDKNFEKFICKIAYRPFDDQYTILSSTICDRPRKEILQHVLNRENYCLLCSSQQAIEGFRHCFITKLPANDCVMSTTSREANQIFPLYLYPEKSDQITVQPIIVRTPNLNSEIIKQMSEKIGLTFSKEKEEIIDAFAPIDVLDYIYAILHSPTYREKYKEFLKIDYPLVPYPKNADTFWNLVKLGGELRHIHLLNSPVVNKFITTYPVNGSNEVTKLKYEDGKVWINGDQYFDHVPQVAWEFYIGGYQPAQKWLKDRKGRILSFEDIQHYQKIIVAMAETNRLMKEIDTVKFEP
jgi:predicted helicase